MAQNVVAPRKKQRIRKIFFLTFITLFLLYLAVRLYWYSQITFDTSLKIQPGMSEREVFFLLGPAHRERQRHLRMGQVTAKTWIGEEDGIAIDFQAGLVVQVHCWGDRDMGQHGVSDMWERVLRLFIW